MLKLEFVGIPSRSRLLNGDAPQPPVNVQIGHRYSISAKEGSDLLDRSNWTISKFWDHREHRDIRPSVNGGEKGGNDAFKFSLGGMVGNPVVTPNGDIWVIHRYGDKKPLILEYDINDPWGELKNGRLIDMPRLLSMTASAGVIICFVTMHARTETSVAPCAHL